MGGWQHGGCSLLWGPPASVLGPHAAGPVPCPQAAAQLLAVLEGGRDELGEDTVHVALVPWEEPLQEADVPAVHRHQHRHRGEAPHRGQGDG